MISELLVYWSLLFGWFVVSLMFHEFGHYIAARTKGYTAKFKCSKKGFKVVVSGVVPGSVDDFNILFWGVVLGYLPSLAVFFNFTTVGFLLVVVWSVGNWRELKLLSEMSKVE